MIKKRIKWDESNLRIDIRTITSKIAMIHPNTIRKVKDDLKSLGDLIDAELQEMEEKYRDL